MASYVLDLDYNENGNLITTKDGEAGTEIPSYKYGQLNRLKQVTKTELKNRQSINMTPGATGQ